MSKQPVQSVSGSEPGPIKPTATDDVPTSGVVAACAGENLSERVNEQPAAGAHAGAAPAGRESRKPSAAVTPSCACQHPRELVYAIGDLDVDFGTLARLDSLQQNADGFHQGGRLDVRINGHLIRHLLGWRDFFTVRAEGTVEEERKGGKTPQRTASAATEEMVLHKPHLHDAQAVIWVLRQDESPVYAIRPSGPYAEAAYLELIHFLMEQEGYGDERQALQREDEPSAIYYPSLDTRDGAEPNRKRDVRGRPVRIVERVAIPGTLNGTVKLYSGSEIPVICPDMRGTRSWSMERLLAFHLGAPAENYEEADYEGEMRNLESIAQRFFEEARNSGLTGEQRALNFAATQAFRSAQDLRKKFGAGVAWELEDISVTPSPTCREDSECYDVETAFFDPDNVLRSKIVQAQTFDVSDVVPVLLGEVREYRRR